MPFISERQQLLSHLEKTIAFANLEDDEEEEEETALLYSLVSSSRFISDHSPQVRSSHYFINIFPLISDNEFRSMFRTTRLGFMGVLEEIKDDPVFWNNSTCAQVQPIYQLAVALSRFGVNGAAAGLLKWRALFGIGFGTVGLFTKRVITALLKLKNKYLVWPNAERRKEISAVMTEEGFPGCVGFIDGTTIPLSQKPARDGQVYYDRKKRYQLFC